MKNQLDNTNGLRPAHRGIYTFDLLFAVLIVLIMFYFAASTAMEFSKELSYAHSDYEGRHKAFLISERIISRDITISDTQSYQNYVDLAKLGNINMTEIMQDFRILTIDIHTPFSDPVSGGIFSPSNKYCYNRIVLVSGVLPYPGRMRVCIQT